MRFIKEFIPKFIPYIWRQGLNNLYRPYNQTQTLILSLGIGTFLLMTLYLSQNQLLNQVKRSEKGNNPNIVLFDIQIDQLDSVKKMLHYMDLPVLKVVPMVSMRLTSVKGQSVEDIRRKNRDHRSSLKIPEWTLNRQYRSTFRDHLIDSEELIQGNFSKEFLPEKDNLIPVSIEKEIAKDLRINLGDELVFDVQGIPLNTVITSIRKVDWYKIQPNFFVVFPVGVLEDAPQMIVAVTRVANAKMSADLQKMAVKKFPNLSIVDLTLVLDTINGIMDKVTYAIESMAVFSIITGLIVLVCSISLSRFQRIRECVLLKIIGASQYQILGIMSAEYFILGFIGANTGIILALSGSYALSKLVFETDFIFEYTGIIGANFAVIGITLIVGLVSSISIYRQPALEVMRNGE